MMTAISKYFLIFLATSFFVSCSTPKKINPLFVINIEYMEGLKKSCNLKILTEAKQKAEATSKSQFSKCTLTAKVQRVDENGYKMSVKFKHLKNDILISEENPTFTGVFNKPFTSEIKDIKNNQRSRFTVTVSKANSL